MLCECAEWQSLSAHFVPGEVCGGEAAHKGSNSIHFLVEVLHLLRVNVHFEEKVQQRSFAFWNTDRIQQLD